MLLLLVVLVVGAEVSATTPRRPPPKCPFPSGPYVQPKCGPNEYFEVCSYPCPSQNCSTLWTKYQCPEACCKPECRCKDGFLRDDKSGKCIRQDECSARKCPLFEHWEACPSVCQNETCMSKNPDYKCLLPAIPLPCKPRCICDKGFLRNTFGQCIPENHCPTSLRCGINEVAVDCASVIPQTCESVYTLYKPVGKVPCKPGCDCRPGYLRNKRNICVPSEFCPTVPQNQCGPNQEYKECGTACEPSCADLDNPNQICTDQCVAGCFCKDGYRKDDQGNCVTRDKCPLPVCTQPNEVATDCGSGCNDRNCDDYKRTDIVCPAVCIRGCFCAPGYVRNAYGVCIPPNQCHNCDNYLDNKRICTANCVPGCNCKAGFVRNLEDKTCVKPEQCPSKNCTGLNESLNLCASYCPVTCANRFTNGDWLCATVCRTACDCISGTLRNDSGVCVPVEQCTPPVCRQNEKYLNCGTACPLTCDNYKNPPKVCTRQCVEDCFCEDGFVRDRNMRCVKPENCAPQPTCSNATEVYSPCSAHCEPTCENSSPYRPCTRICKPGCKCIDGLVRRKDGQCVKVEECSQLTCSGDEVFDACSAHCEPTCENNGPNRVCTAICKPGCKCGDGLVRRKDGKCVKLKDCSAEPSCPAQEVYDPCSAHCEPTCENNGPDRACTDICSPGCKCEDGLVRRSDGKCVKLKECQNTPQCPLNERWVPCVIGLCAPKSCDELGFPVACPEIIGPCKGGCVCAENYLRNSNGVCIPQKDCPSCGGDFNATSGCGINCGNHCSNYNKPNNCSSLPLFCQYNGCDCKDGYVYNDAIKRCISPSDCPNNNQPCSDPNAERVECATQCPSTCANPIPGPCIASCKLNECVCKKGFILSERGGKCVSVDQCPTPNAWPYCKKYAPEVGCECKPGFLKSTDDIDGKCIKPDECKGGNPCGVNGTFVWCNTGCPTNNCPVSDNRGIIACSPPNPCPSGCACKLNYRHKSSADITCILASDCPITSACTDPNAERVECAPAPGCRPTCDAPNPGPCILSCALNECVCKKGFILSEKGGKCIPANQCPAKPIKCKANEVYNPCSIICPPQTCASIYSSYSCPNAPKLCKPGCDCINEYLRNGTENDLCIPSSQCPAPKPACGLNEHYEINRSKCDLTCKNKDQEALIGPCQETTKPITCPANEVLSECYNTCHTTCKTRIRGDGRACSLACVDSGCLCKSGYLRHDNGTCVPVNECSPPACNKNEAYTSCGTACPETCLNRGGNCTTSCTKHDPNEVFDSCPPTCPPGDNCSNLWSKFDCSKFEKCCKPGCRCKPGYYRNNGKCITTQQCTPPYCNNDEEYNSCGASCLDTCDQRGNTCQDCSLRCVKGCFCPKGFFREPNGACVKAEDCPPRTCNGPNEYFDECPPTCLDALDESCSTIWSGVNCTETLDCCEPQCRCKTGYYRDTEGFYDGIDTGTPWWEASSTSKPQVINENSIPTTSKING
ncbi:hypothetical protein MSG28_007986 [Choristoneura fumiferana]|uniref:Uncharacterized protein n=1 Tax=Choristoneura fumiferana TaxID=7141 RepID=A0ACC0J9I2_CHOFU|nr:hypothetical protein MSG28_007986 [Choristoneura fumiferana]